MAKSPARSTRTKRVNLRATPRQAQLIRTGAERTGVSVTEFVLNSACLQAEHVLADRRDFAVSPQQWQTFVDTLDRPAQINPKLARLFSESKASRTDRESDG